MYSGFYEIRGFITMFIEFGFDPYFKPGESVPHPHTDITEVNFNVILPYTSFGFSD
jgi:hypothetical protein